MSTQHIHYSTAVSEVLRKRKVVVISHSYLECVIKLQLLLKMLMTIKEVTSHMFTVKSSGCMLNVIHFAALHVLMCTMFVKV